MSNRLRSGLRASVRGLSGPALSLLFAEDGVLDSRVTFSRPSNAMMSDSTGKLTYAPNNHLLNSATLATQNVTSAPFPYILSFRGTGSVTLSGTATGTLSGTGANDRVHLRFTPTAGTLTLTVSGTVNDAMLERVTYQTAPRPYIATTSAMFFGARFDHDPVTLAARGLLIEEARTNLLVHSEEFDNASWTKNNSTIVANSIVSLDGMTTTDKLVENTATAIHSVTSTFSVSASTRYTASCYVIAAERSAVTLVLGPSTFFGSGGVAATFNLANQTIVSITDNATASPSATITHVGGGVYRVTLSATSNATSGTAQCHIQLFNGGHSYAGDGTSGIYIWGAQLEAGAFATSYIPTAAATVTRSADSASMTGTNFSSWYNQSEGTFVAGFTTPAVGSRAILAVDDNTANEQMRLRTEGLDPFFRVVDGGVEQAAIDAGTVSAGTLQRFAAAYAANDFAACLNGGAVGTDASGTLPTVDRLRIGGDQEGSPLNGHIRSIRYYNSRRPNAELQSMTAA